MGKLAIFKGLLPTNFKVPFIHGKRTPYTQEEELAHKERVAGYQGEIKRNKNMAKEIELGAQVMVSEIEKRQAIAEGKTEVLKAEQDLIQAEGKRDITQVETDFVRGKTQHEVQTKTRETVFKLKEMTWHK